MLEFLELPCLAINELAIIRYYSDLEIVNTNLSPNFEFDNLSDLLKNSKESTMFISRYEIESIVRIVPISGFNKSVCTLELEKPSKDGLTKDHIKYIIGTPTEILKLINDELKKWNNDKLLINVDLTKEANYQKELANMLKEININDICKNARQSFEMSIIFNKEIDSQLP